MQTTHVFVSVLLQVVSSCYIALQAQGQSMSSCEEATHLLQTDLRVSTSLHVYDGPRGRPSLLHAQNMSGYGRGWVDQAHDRRYYTPDKTNAGGFDKHHRPSEITEVEFGLRLKTFYDIDFIGETWTADVVMINKWNDTRNAALIPQGDEELRIDNEDAGELVWLPNTVITNRAHNGVDIISSSALISRDGTTTTVERGLMTLKANYDGTEFPFDQQPLEIRIASRSYMADEVKFVPTRNPAFWGADADMFGSWSLLDSEIFSLREVDGILDKSRGVLHFDVKRSPAQYVDSVFEPSVFLLGMSWTSLWLPLSAPFTMPRIALNSISLLAQVTLAQKVDGMAPAGTASWLGRYMAMCFSLQFMLMFMNGVILCLEHKYNLQLAKETDLELIFIFPGMWFLGFLLLWTCPYYADPIIGLLSVIYVFFVGTRYYKSK